MKAEVIENPPRSFWDQVAAESSLATPYHAPLWAEALVRAYRKYEIATIGFLFEDGTQAIIPMLSSARGLFVRRRRYKSFGFGSYGGPIYTGTWDEEKTEAVFSFFKNRKARLHFDGNPLWHHRFPQYVQQQQIDTYVLRLDQPLEDIFRNFSDTHRRGIKTATKRGVVIRRSSTDADIDAYRVMYADSINRWGDATIIRFPEGLIRTMLKSDPEHVTLWIAEVEGRAVAGIIVLYWNSMAHYWLGATRQGCEEYHAPVLLQWHAIQDACARSLLLYDFAPSGSLSGVEEFKRRFGAEKVTFVRGHLRG